MILVCFIITDLLVYLLLRELFANTKKKNKERTIKFKIITFGLSFAFLQFRQIGIGKFRRCGR